MKEINVDDLMEYLIVNDKVDEFFGLKEEQDDDDEKDKEEENNKGRRR